MTEEQLDSKQNVSLPCFFPLQTHPLLHTAPQKKKKKFLSAQIIPLLKPTSLTFSNCWIHKRYAEALICLLEVELKPGGRPPNKHKWPCPKHTLVVVQCMTYLLLSLLPLLLTRSVSIAYFCSLPLECQASQSERSRTTGHGLSTLRPPPLMTHVI